VNVESDHTGEAVQALDVGQLVASTTRVNLGEVAVGSSRRALVTLTQSLTIGFSSTAVGSGSVAGCASLR
jgi:hypothetical protein